MKRLFHSFVGKKDSVVGKDELERKSHINKGSKEMLIQKDDRSGKE